MAKQNYFAEPLHVVESAGLVGRYDVINPELLREIVAGAKARMGDNLADLAKERDFDQPHLWKLLKRATSSVHATTFSKLLSLTLDRFKVWGVVLGQSGQELLGAYSAWLHRSLTRVITDDTRWMTDPYGFTPVQPEKGYSHRAARARSILAEIRSGFTGYIEPFERFARNRGHSPARIELALYRVVEPLLASAESGLVELGWNELTTAQRKRYLKAAFARERVLLSRVGDVQRLQQIEALEREEREQLAGRSSEALSPLPLWEGVSKPYEDLITLPDNFRLLGFWKWPIVEKYRSPAPRRTPTR